MPGIVELNELLTSLSPEICPRDYVFCTAAQPAEAVEREALATFREKEGVTLVLPKEFAESHRLEYDGVFRQITLSVHSSLEAVGLTAAVATKLAERGISANVIAAYHHDHVFVPSADASAALSALIELSENTPG
jgi:uncharacterized protein